MRLLRVGLLAGVCLLLSACDRANPGEAVQPPWDGKSTLNCPPSPRGDKQSLVITDCKADLPEKAVSLNHCDVTLVRCDIKGGDWAVEINNDSKLTLKDSTIRGKFGIDANNQSSVVIEGGRVEGTEVGLMIENGSTLELRSGTIRGRTGIFVRGGASATLAGGRVEGTNKALDVDDATATVQKGVTIAGHVVREGQATVTGIDAEEDYVADIRSKFAKEHSCPEDRVKATLRPEIDAMQFHPRKAKALSAEVKADPERYAKWKADDDEDEKFHRKYYGRNHVYEVSGCNITELQDCGPYHNMRGRITTGAADCQVVKVPRK